MNAKSIKHIVSLCVLAIAWPCSSIVRADETVLPGWDLLSTLSSSNLYGVNWQGVPLETFDFGTGPLGVDSTDTIIQRLNTITSIDVPSPIEVVALQLCTVDQVSLGGGPWGYYYVTLNTTQPSSGTMTIDSFPSGASQGTFEDSFDVHFDVRYGSPEGPIVMPNVDCHFSTTGAHWDINAPSWVPSSLELSGINYLLNGTDTSEDFWPTDSVIPHVTGGGEHDVHATPEPATICLLGLGGLMLKKRRAL